MMYKQLIPVVFVFLSGCATTETTSDTLATNNGMMEQAAIKEDVSYANKIPVLPPVVENGIKFPTLPAPTTMPLRQDAPPFTTPPVKKSFTPNNGNGDNQAFFNRSVNDDYETFQKRQTTYKRRVPSTIKSQPSKYSSVSSSFARPEPAKPSKMSDTGRGGYLQLGIFSNYDNAQALQQKVVSNQMPEPAIKEVRVAGNRLYRVQFSVSSPAKVNELKAKLARIGLTQSWYVAEK